MPPKSGPITWEDFTAKLKAIYWPSLAPAARQTSRVLADGTRDPVVPHDIWQAMLVIFPDPEAWLENPVPQLRGQTPMAALQKGRTDEVRGIIMGVADFFLPDPSEVVPWSEFEDAVAEYEREVEAADAAPAAKNEPAE